MNALRRDHWWIRQPRTAVAVVAITAMGLHALFLGTPLAPDEGGYLLVAGQWPDGGPLLYGHLWVDRPPLLLVAFAIAGQGGAVGIHILACLCAGTVVSAAGWAGWAAAGRNAGLWSALTAGALSASTLIDAQELDGELLAIPFIMLSCALALHAWNRKPRHQYVLVVAAGVAAAAAPMVKQNFLEGIAFALVFLGVHIVRGDDRARAVRMFTVFSAGVATGLACVAGWAISQGKLGQLWFATYTFRAQAGAVINAGSWHAPGTRLVQLVGLAIVSGIVGLSIFAAVAHRSAMRRGDPLTWALAAGFLVEIAGIALGGSFWPHYLIGILPMLSLAVGTAIARGSFRAAKALSALVLLACTVTLVTTPFAAANSPVFGTRADRLAEWLGRAAEKGDTAVVTFTHPNILQQSGLSTPYPYVWSLPVRTLDPHLALLKRTVQGPAAPTWIVQWDKFNTWKLDPKGELAGIVAAHYRVVARICGHPIWLRDGVTRSVPAPHGC